MDHREALPLVFPSPSPDSGIHLRLQPSQLPTDKSRKRPIIKRQTSDPQGDSRLAHCLIGHDSPMNTPQRLRESRPDKDGKSNPIPLKSMRTRNSTRSISPVMNVIHIVSQTLGLSKLGLHRPGRDTQMETESDPLPQEALKKEIRTVTPFRHCGCEQKGVS